MNNEVIEPKVRITFYHSTGALSGVRLVPVAQFKATNTELGSGKAFFAAIYKIGERLEDIRSASICPGGRTEFELI